MEPEATRSSGRNDVSDPLLDAARRLLGVDYLFPYQRLVVCNVLEKRNQIVILPTGGGKSLCFLLPAALLHGLTVVVYPLRSLIADQARRLSAGTIPAEPLTGETPRNERGELFDRCRRGATKILLTNPEMLIQPAVRKALARCEISHLVVDEAHVLPEWGGSFRPAYVEFARGASALEPTMTSAFTATASETVIARLVDLLFGGVPPHRVAGVPDRPNIRYSAVPTLSRRHTLNGLIATASRPVLLFCSSRVGAELTARTIRVDTGDERVRFYHAGLEPAERASVESWFFESSDGILATTCAYGMGVDKSDIRTIVHVDVPLSVEAYLQETGRAGRDGATAQAIALIPPSIQIVHRLRSGGSVDSSPERAPPRGAGSFGRRAMLRYLLDSNDCRRRALLAHLGAPEVDCTGCDVCDGTVARAVDPIRRALRFFAVNSGRYGSREAARRLAHRLSVSDGEYWSAAETAEIIDCFSSTGLVGLPKRAFTRLWRGNRLLLRSRGWRFIMSE